MGDLLQNTMLNLHHLIDASLKNQAAKETVKSLERQNLALKLGAYPKDKQAVIEFKKRIKDGEVEAARNCLSQMHKPSMSVKTGSVCITVCMTRLS